MTSDSSIKRLLLLCLTTLMATSVNAMPTNGLVSYWNADGNALDSQDGNHGTLNNGAGYASGINGEAFSLDGDNDYVQIGPQANLTFTDNFTMSAWIYPTGQGHPSNGGIIINKEGEYEFARFPDGSIRWAFDNTNPNWVWINTGYIAQTNRWTHVTISYQGGTVETYINGQPYHTYFGSGTIGDAQVGQDDFRIGGRQFNPAIQNFEGQIDQVAVYNRVLNSTEVQELYASGLPESKPVPAIGLAGLGLLSILLALFGIVSQRRRSS
ncbi:MAG: LamG domain-containing protein [bacterium]